MFDIKSCASTQIHCNIPEMIGNEDIVSLGCFLEASIMLGFCRGVDIFFVCVFGW